ncbi:MAG: hypothetical protein AAF230_11260, partial [Pseudomonadota bacterium]
MSQVEPLQGYAFAMEQKELPTACILYFIGGVLFLHRIYLGDYKPTLVTALAAAFFWGLDATGRYEGSTVLILLFVVFASVWLVAVLTDGWRLE